MIYFISRIIYKVLLNILGKFEVSGEENLPKKGPFIIAANHVSYADPVVAGVLCRVAPVRFMAKKELFENPKFGWWFKACQCIPIERDSKSFKPLKEAIEKLKKGEIVGIFPEGTRSPDGELHDPGLGIGLLAVKSGAPIVPVFISGTEKALPKGSSKINPTKVKAKVGKPIAVNSNNSSKDKKKLYESISRSVMGSIAQLKNE